MRFFALAFGMSLIWSPLWVEAGCRVVRQAVAVQEVQQVYATPVAVAVFAPIAVQVPVNSIGYASGSESLPPATAAEEAAKADEAGGNPFAKETECERSLRELRSRLAALEGRVGTAQVSPTNPVPPVKDQQLPILRFFQARGCVLCHDSSVASVKGNNLTLTYGNRVKSVWTVDEVNAVVKQVRSGKMPKKPDPFTPAEFERIKPTDADMDLVMEWWDEMTTKLRKQ